VSAQLTQTAAVGTHSPLVLGAGAVPLGTLAGVALGSAGGVATLGIVLRGSIRRCRTACPTHRPT
jgi:hypothetical protein